VRRADPAALSAWYRDCLGPDADENGLWRPAAGPAVFAAVESETDYFGSGADPARLPDIDSSVPHSARKRRHALPRPRRPMPSEPSDGAAIARSVSRT
jgi:hypothetical protein